MIHISSDAAAVLAQIVAVIVFASIIELRRALKANPWWEIRATTLGIFLTGGALSMGILIELIAITAKDGADIEIWMPLEVWIASQFLWPTLIFLWAESMRVTGEQMAKSLRIEESIPDDEPVRPRSFFKGVFRDLKDRDERAREAAR